MFRWKEHNNLWKGPGIYHLTFTTPNRQPLFGKLVMAPCAAPSPAAPASPSSSSPSSSPAAPVNSLPAVAGVLPPSSPSSPSPSPAAPVNSLPAAAGSLPPSSPSPSPSSPSAPVNSLPAAAGVLPPAFPAAFPAAFPSAPSSPSAPVNSLPAAAGVLPPARVQLSELGFRISEDLQRFGERHPGVKLCAKQIMPDHLHVVLWVYEDSKKSIKELAHGFRKGITNIAVELHVWGENGAYLPLIETGTAPAQSPASPASPASPSLAAPAAPLAAAAAPAAPAASSPAAPLAAAPSPSALPSPAPASAPVNSLPAAAGIPAARRGFVLSEPYIRTLAHRGQLRSMIDYVHANPFRALAKRMNPELFTLHRETRIAGLTFSSMGNHWLLDWPVKQLIQCSRSISAAMLEEQLQRCLAAAANGAVSLTAAISKGEQQIARALREAFMPLVILLKDGFPPVGSEHEKYYKPGGVYFEACSKGKLLLLEPTPAAYDAPQVIAATEKALQAKAAAKHFSYVPLPRTSDRWRFMAGNCMLEMLTAI